MDTDRKDEPTLENSYGIDWKVVSEKLPAEKNPARFQAGELSGLYHWRLVAASKFLNKSVAAIIQTAIITYLDRQESKHALQIRVEAELLGISPEEYIVKIVNEKTEAEKSRKDKARKSTSKT